MKRLPRVYVSHLIEKPLFIDVLDQYEVGIETIEFSISQVLDLDDQGVSAYVEALQPYIHTRGLSLHGPFFDLPPATFDSKIREVVMARFEAVYQIGRSLGADRIIFHSGFIPITYYIEGWLGNSIKFWQEFMKDKNNEVKVHLENVYEEEFFPLAKVIDEVDHPSFSVCLDVGHVNAYSTKTMEEWINGIGHRIGHVHLHNNNGKRDEHRGVELGTIEMKDVMRQVERVAPGATYTLEIADQDQIVHSLEWLWKQKWMEE